MAKYLVNIFQVFALKKHIGLRNHPVNGAFSLTLTAIMDTVGCVFWPCF